MVNDLIKLSIILALPIISATFVTAAYTVYSALLLQAIRRQAGVFLREAPNDLDEVAASMEVLRARLGLAESRLVEAQQRVEQLSEEPEAEEPSSAESDAAQEEIRRLRNEIAQLRDELSAERSGRQKAEEELAEWRRVSTTGSPGAIASPSALEQRLRGWVEALKAAESKASSSSCLQLPSFLMTIVKLAGEKYGEAPYNSAVEPLWKVMQLTASSIVRLENITDTDTYEVED